MKLLSCYVENYGKISKRRYDFNNNPTSICEANGFGKTTLASFLKAMFYGLEGYTLKTKDFCDRKRYYPFSGGNFGGNVTFEYAGDTYKVERFFDEKSEIKDTLTVFKNGEEFLGFDGEVGENLFGIDKESFERTLFISDTDMKISATSSIGKKLDGFIGGDNTDFDRAIDLLEETAKKYKKSKKANDLITEEKEKNERIRAEIAGRQEIKASLGEKYFRLNRIREEFNEVNAKLKSSAKENEAFAQWENYDKLVENAKKIREDISLENAKYPLGVPTEEELRSAGKKIERLAVLKAQSKEKEKSEKYERLKEKFSGGVPSKGELAEAESRIIKYAEVERDYLAQPDFIEETAGAEKTKKNYLPIIALALGGAGIALAFFNLTVGVIVALVGFLSSAFFYLNGKTEAIKGAAKVSAINPRKAELKDALTEEKRLIGQFFIKYGYKTEGDFPSALALLRRDIEDYGDYARAEREEEENARKREEEIKSLNEELSSLFDRYGIAPAEYLGEIERIKTHIGRAKALNERLYEVEEEAKNFAKAKNLTERPAGEKADVGELLQRQAVCSNEIAKIEKEIEEAEWQAEKIDDLEADKAVSDEKLKEYARRHALLKASAELLIKAEESIVEKYVSPVREDYERYAEILEKALGERISMNKNFEITFEEGGKERSEMHRSQGERTIVALCYRLALIDNMFKTEKPFVILDDPFVYLDNEHIGKVKALIRELSSSIQIIYFTCHESRII